MGLLYHRKAGRATWRRLQRRGEASRAVTCAAAIFPRQRQTQTRNRLDGMPRPPTGLEVEPAGVAGAALKGPAAAARQAGLLGVRGES